MNMEKQIDYLKRNLKIAKILKKADSLLVFEKLLTLALIMAALCPLPVLVNNWLPSKWIWFIIYGTLFIAWTHCYYKSFSVIIEKTVQQQRINSVIEELKKKGLYEQFLSEPLFTNIDKVTQLQYHNHIKKIILETKNKIKDLEKQMKNEKSQDDTKLSQAEKKFLDLTQNQAFIARILYNKTPYKILDAVFLIMVLFVFITIAAASLFLMMVIDLKSDNFLSFGLGSVNIIIIAVILMFVTIAIFDKIDDKISNVIIGRKAISNKKLKKALAQIKAWGVYDVFMQEDVFKRITQSEKPILYSDIKYVFKQIENEIKEQYKIVQIEKSKERDKKIVKQQKEYIAMFAENKNSINLNKGNKK